MLDQADPESPFGVAFGSPPAYAEADTAASRTMKLRIVFVPGAPEIDEWVAQAYHMRPTFTCEMQSVSRQSEKFLIGQSRKFLLTAVRLKDGTNRDEPTGTGRAGLSETSQGRKHQPTGGRPEDRSERPMGEEVAQADDQARRRGGRAWATRAALQSQAAGRDSTTSGEAFEATGLARFRPNVRQPTTRQTAWDRSQRRDRAEVDDRGRTVAKQVATAGRGACLAASSNRFWRTGAMGHLGARLAGRKRTGALPGAHDRRRDQLELGPLRRDRKSVV